MSKKRSKIHLYLYLVIVLFVAVVMYVKSFTLGQIFLTLFLLFVATIIYWYSVARFVGRKRLHAMPIAERTSERIKTLSEELKKNDIDLSTLACMRLSYLCETRYDFNTFDGLLYAKGYALSHKSVQDWVVKTIKVFPTVEELYKKVDSSVEYMSREGVNAVLKSIGKRCSYQDYNWSERFLWSNIGFTMNGDTLLSIQVLPPDDGDQKIVNLSYKDIKELYYQLVNEGVVPDGGGLFHERSSV